MKSAIVSIVVGSLIVLVLAGIGIVAVTFYQTGSRYAQSGPRYATPQAVWEAEKQALASRDWKTLFNVFTPETKDQMVGGLAHYGWKFTSANERTHAIQNKYGIVTTSHFPASVSDLAQLQEQLKAAANSINDKQGFFVDAMVYFRDKGTFMTHQLSQQVQTITDKDSELTEIVIDGEIARGKQIPNRYERAAEIPVEFRKVDGGWLIHNATASWESSPFGSFASGNSGTASSVIDRKP